MPYRRAPRWDATASDEELVAWAQAGEREAFGLLYDRHGTGVYRYCYRLLGDREAAEDANSQTFTKAFAALPGYRARGFRSWLYAIAHNVITDVLRARRADRPLEAAALVPDPRPTMDETAIGADELDMVLALLPRLSEDQRHVVALRLSGLKAIEIADVLGKPRNAIDGIQHRAVLRLQELLAVRPEPATTEGART